MIGISPDELPNRAFQLAYFLHRERKTAVEIATRSLNKLQLAATAQGKRLYYRLTGRADRKARSKVSMGEPHLLQRLVYVESEEFERQKENAALDPQSKKETKPARYSDLIVFFIKHLVRITTKRNSFYVTLGLGRLLYNYTTAETMEIYNLVIQDPDRVHDDYYYRSRKGVLLKELKDRFGPLVEIVKGNRGEQRWETSENNSVDGALVRECLVWFTPWETPCVVPEQFDPLTDQIEELNFDGRHPDEEHEVEVNRIHAALHPDCFARLAAANGLTAPDERLELPHFFLVQGDDDADENSRTPPNLSDEELNTINVLLAQEANRRKAAATGFLRVLVDGTEVAEINVAHSSVAQFEVNEGAELIEVYGADRSGPLVMATHLLDINHREPGIFDLTLESGQRISFTVKAFRGQEGANGARVTVTFEETTRRKAWSMAGRWKSGIGTVAGTTFGWWKPVAAFTVMALLFMGAWLVWQKRGTQNVAVKVIPTPAPATAAPSPSRPEIIKPEQSPPESLVNKGKNTEASQTPLIAQGPIPETMVTRTYVPGGSSETEPAETGTRAWDREIMGKRLAEIHQVYVQPVGNSSSDDEFMTELQASVTRSGAVKLVGGEQADAALKFSLQNLSPAESRVIVTVRAVNAKGYVVWPAGGRGGSWRYVGSRPHVAARIVRDLTRDIKGAKR